jgi:uncharacterized protein YecE (DUF72 family)
LWSAWHFTNTACSQENIVIWIGTSGWVYPHWIGRFYPPGLPEKEWLPYYAQHFPTVEINRSFYRLPTYDQFHTWAEQTASHPGFLFAVKASRYITHMKKLKDPDEGITRLLTAAKGLGKQLGPFLYQLPPRWHANPQRLAEFISHLPHDYPAAFEFRDPSWFQPETLAITRKILEEAGCALAIAIGGSLSTPLDIPPIGPFSYIRFHNGAHGIGLSDHELAFWAKRISAQAEDDREVYVYFNNDLDAHAINDAFRLRQMLGAAAVPPH